MKSTRNRHILANTLAGLFLGIGVSLIVTLYGRVSWSTTTPDLIIVAGVVLGLVVGLLPVRTTRAPAPTSAVGVGPVAPHRIRSTRRPGSESPRAPCRWRRTGTPRRRCRTPCSSRSRTRSRRPDASLITALSGHTPKQLSHSKQLPHDRQRRASNSGVRPRSGRSTTSSKVAPASHPLELAAARVCGASAKYQVLSRSNVAGGAGRPRPAPVGRPGRSSMARAARAPCPTADGRRALDGRGVAAGEDARLGPSIMVGDHDSTPSSTVQRPVDAARAGRGRCPGRGPAPGRRRRAPRTPRSAAGSPSSSRLHPLDTQPAAVRSRRPWTASGR